MTPSAKFKAIRPEAYRLQGLPGLQAGLRCIFLREELWVIMENWGGGLVSADDSGNVTTCT